MSHKGMFERLNGWLMDNYGSRRGFVRTWWHRLRYLLGGYRAYRRVDWNSVERLVFVCKGNICRSAYAGVLADSQGVETASCGLNTRPGLPANERAVQAALLRGVDLKAHRTTPIEMLDIKKNDLFVVMEPWQAEQLKSMYGNEYGYTLLGLWGRPASPHVQDPYGKSKAYFNRCFSYIDMSVYEILRKISQTN